jgi:hypothetical protein
MPDSVSVISAPDQNRAALMFRALFDRLYGCAFCSFPMLKKRVREIWTMSKGPRQLRELA